MLPRNKRFGLLLIGLVFCIVASEIVPASGLECYHCAGDDCDDPEVKDCTVENDQCYIRIDETFSFVGMGCASTLGDDTAIANLIKNKELYLCSSANCNGYENVPSTNECTVCDSTEDVKCAVQPSTTGKSKRCGNVPYTQCYERVNVANNGTTERGCLVDLESDDFYNCLTGQNKNCNVCVGSACNTGVIPADRTQCQRCVSESDSTCASSPTALSICPQYSANDTCVSVYESGVTRRGCSSEFTCDATSKNCEICTGTGCNTANVQKRAEELYGIFQDLPLNCYTCTGDECVTSKGKIRKCNGDIYQDCLTVFDSTGSVTARGCESAIDAEYQTHCAANPELCFNCKSNGCNNYTAVTAAQECIYCDAASNADCLTNPLAVTSTRKCVEGCVSALYESKTNSKVQDLARLCFEDVEFDDRETCTEENNCVKCTGEKCNTVVLPTEGRLSCLHCSGDDCDDPQSQVCTGYSTSDQCYIFFDHETHSAVRMGCMSSEPVGAIYNDILHYFLCDGDDCNNYSNLPEANICYVCNSANDVNCAIDMTKITAQVRCQINPHTDCFSRINEAGHTVRGCISTLNNTEFLSCHEGTPGEFCRICTETNCNANIYPSSRQRCYRCNSADDPSCEKEPTTSTVCPLFDEDDYCVTKLIDGVVHRGCATELQCEGGVNSKTCQTCEDQSCNDYVFEEYPIGDPGYFQDLPLNCYRCNGTEECGKSGLGNIRKCDGNTLQTCTTVFSQTSGDVIGRGCSDAWLEECDADDSKCYNCKSNGCNVAKKEDDYINCIFCDAQTDERCLTDVNEITSTRKCYKSCVTALYNRTNDATPVRELLRSCLDDMDLDDREICASGKDSSCVACDTEKCNNAEVGERISCYQCVGDECQEPVAKTCRAVTEGDQCFVEYDETGSIVELGCKSKYDPAEVKLRIIAKQLWLCDGENCNSIDGLPAERQVCKICSSLTDQKCAIAPSNVTAQTTCAKRPYNQCYSRLLSDGHTERGCLSSIEGEEFYDCLTGADTSKCLACVGDSCNAEIYPANRLSCHQCNSSNSASCEVKPEAAGLCLKYSDSESCVSTVDSQSNTIRGCSSQVKCDSDICQTCAEDDCNTSNLKRKLDGKPGQWQDVPITCKVCDSKSDCAGTSSDLVCPKQSDYCMTVFDTDGSVVKRGCSAAVEAELGTYCDANADNCHNCNSNGCNTVSALTDYVNCVYCDSATNADCVSAPESIGQSRQCNKYCMTALRSRKTNPDIFDVSRSCLDDKEVVDQASCRAGSDDCLACEGALCNTAKLPAKRRSCYSCVGEECVTPEVAECVAYKEDDQCFVLFDSLSDVQRMGCLTELEDSFVESNIHLLLLCNENDNCNGFESFPEPTTCYQCDSDEDETCAVSSSEIQTLTKCSALPHVECYSRVLSDGTTRRGCASALSQTDLLDCLSGNSSTCQTCTDDLCNGEIFPAGRRSCQRCNSTADPSCESSPDAASICPLYKEDQFCATKLVNGYTYRGCSTEFQCDVSNKQSCRHCSGSDNCNTVDLNGNDIGLPGKWQDLPLSCYDCTADDCANSTAGSLHQCEYNNVQNCETVFDATGTVVRRGCSDDVLATHGDYCEENQQKCLGCKSNACNNATSLTQFVDCYWCDSVDNSTCAVGFDAAGAKKRKCQGHCVVALYPRSSAENPSYELTRTCLDDLELEDREKCLAGENELCAACEGALCNTASLPANRQKCYKCVNGDCAENVVAECSVYQPDDQCYMTFDDENSVLDMGCRSDIESDVLAVLIKQKRLLLCDGEACNGPESIPTAKTCSACDSETDARCATNPNLVSETERCSNLPYTHCYTRVKENGHTARGCVSNLSEDIFYTCVTGNDTLCLPCLGDKCNALDVFPTGRQLCHQCNSETEPLCSTAPDSNKVCPIYSAQDSCVTNLRDGITTRGCASSMSCDDENDRNTCRTCNGSGCNTVNLENALDQGKPGRWQDVPITCRTCVGEEACESLGNYRVCTGNNYQSCMTVFNTAGKVIQRGCSDTVETANSQHCSDYPTNCLSCNSNGCNNSTRLADYIDCLYCDTDTNADCLNNPASIQKTRKCNTYCMSALYAKYEETNPAYALARTCFDDMDLDEREACAAGSNPYCQVCAEANCNTHTVPTKRLSCNVCQGDECQDPQPATCINYREDDKCYIQFDEGRSIIGMGCRSEFSNADADYLLQKKRLFYCDGDNCNNFDALPSSQYCRICSSRTDAQCATNPDLVSASTTCSYLPYTECYTRILESGVTERGCLSSLYDDDFASCLNGTAAHCTACTGNYCNNQVYPEKRLSCHVCDSTKNSTCTNNPDSVSICPIYAEGDTCVTAYENDVTYRGCSSSIGCDPTDTRKCVQCSGEACNTVNLARKQDDNFGKWQDLPLTCLTCVGETACANISSAESHTCENNNEQDCVTVFQDGKVVQRGCSDEVELAYGDYCDNNSDDCLNCKSNTCNNGTVQTQYQDCIYCDTHKNLSCLWSPQSDTHNTRKCQGACMTALYPSDSGTEPTYELIRTCLDDKEVADRRTCSNGRDALCQSCVGANCNTAVLPAARLSCYQCEGDNCDEPELKYCPLYKSGDQCFTWYDETNSIAQMGCISSFRNQKLETIIGTKRVQVCEGDACNSLAALPTPQKCAVCDSNTDYACAVNALQIGTFDTCGIYPYTNCYTKVVSTDGSTKRGCLTELDTSEFVACVLGNDKNCSVCLGEGCNREIFPEDRKQCYKCSSEDDSTCESDPTRLEPCPYVAETELCMTALSNTTTIRGCSSEILCDVNDRNCVSCVGTACNYIDLIHRAEDDGMHGLWQNLPLRCHTCEGDHCLHSLGPAKNCSGSVDQDCATVFNASGEVIRRGCFDEVELYEQRHCRENPELCFNCKSNECNDAWDIDDYIECNFCDSETNPLCATDPLNTNFPKRACQKECMVALKDSRVIRSCLDDKELYHRYQCRDGSGECASCNTTNCNNFVYPEERFSCHVCSDSSCSTSVSEVCSKTVANDSCFAKYDNGKPQLLGCASSQSDSDLAAWEQENILYTCSEKDCNALAQLPTEGVKCVSCDSSLTPACAQNPAQVTATQTCAALQTQCVSHVSTAGHTLRGCLSSLSQAEQSSCQAAGSCAICEGNSCNNEIFPTNRRKCHICSSAVNSECAKDPNYLQVCPLYAADDRCVTTRGEYTERGCESSQLTCDTSDDHKCQICTGDGCNTVELSGSAALVSSLLTSLVLAIVAMLVIT